MTLLIRSMLIFDRAARSTRLLTLTAARATLELHGLGASRRPAVQSEKKPAAQPVENRI